MVELFARAEKHQAPTEMLEVLVACGTRIGIAGLEKLSQRFEAGTVPAKANFQELLVSPDDLLSRVGEAAAKCAGKLHGLLACIPTEVFDITDGGRDEVDENEKPATKQKSNPGRKIDRFRVIEKLKYLRKRLSKVDVQTSLVAPEKTALGDIEAIRRWEKGWLETDVKDRREEPVLADNLERAAAQLLAPDDNRTAEELHDLATELLEIRRMLPVPIATIAAKILKNAP